MIVVLAGAAAVLFLVVALIGAVGAWRARGDAQMRNVFIAAVALPLSAVLARWTLLTFVRSGALERPLLTGALNIASLGIFVAFVAFGLRTATSGLESAATRARINLFIGFIVITVTSAALLQRHFWPFASWRMVPIMAPVRVGTTDDQAANYRFIGVTADGRQYRVDHRAWEPFTEAELVAWLFYAFPRLAESDQRQVGEWMLDRINRGRRSVRAGGEPGYFGRVFGPLTAPSHFLYHRFWSAPEDVPDEPFTQIRWYRESYDVVGLWKGTDTIELELEFAFPPEGS